MLAVILLMIFLPFTVVIFSLLVASSRSSRMLEELMTEKNVKEYKV